MHFKYCISTKYRPGFNYFQIWLDPVLLWNRPYIGDINKRNSVIPIWFYQALVWDGHYIETLGYFGEIWYSKFDMKEINSILFKPGKQLQSYFCLYLNINISNATINSSRCYFNNTKYNFKNIPYASQSKNNPKFLLKQFHQRSDCLK